MDSIRPQDVRPDPIITSWAVQYGSGGGFVADEVAPPVEVAQRDFKYFTYKADQLNDEVETRVGPDGKPSEYRFQKGTTATASAERHALDGTINRETELSLMNPVLGQQSRVQKLTYRLRMGIEKRVHTLFHAASNSAAAGTAWDATTPNPIKNLHDAVGVLEVRLGTVETPHILINLDTARALARFIGTTVIAGRPDLYLAGLLPQGLWGFTWHIAGALTNTGNPKADFSQTIARVWSDKEAYVFVQDPTPTLESMGFVYQTRWNQYGSNYSGYTWADPHQSTHRTWYSVENFQNEIKVCDAACQRITGVLT